MNKTQKGFAALEGLLILVVIGILAGTGWYVMKAKSQTDKTLDQANKTSTSTLVVSDSVKKVTGTSLELKSLGIKAPLAASLSGLLYKEMKATDGTPMAMFSTAELDSKGQCSIYGAGTGVLGAVFKYQGQYPADATDENISGSLEKQFQTFNIQYRQPQGGPCFTDANLESSAQQLRSDFIKTLQDSTEIK